MANYRQIFRSTGLLGSVQLLYILIAILRDKVAHHLYWCGWYGIGRPVCPHHRTVRQCDQLWPRHECCQTIGRTLRRGRATKRKVLCPFSRPFSSVVYKQVCVIRTWVLFTAILGTLTCLALAPLLSRWATDSPNHTEAFYLLAPIVGLTTLTSGEMAILKATRRLRRLASATSAGAVATLFLTSSLYAWLGVKGIVPALVLFCRRTLHLSPPSRNT